MFVDTHLPVIALAPDANRYSGDPASDVFNLTKHRECTFVLQEGAGGTGTATITVEACDNFTPDNVDAIPFQYQVSGSGGVLGALTEATAAGFTTTAGADKTIAITVRAEQLPDGFPCVRLKLEEVVASAVDAGVVAILGEARFNVNVSPIS